MINASVLISFFSFYDNWESATIFRNVSKLGVIFFFKSEMWRYENRKITERICLKLFQYMFRLKSSMPSLILWSMEKLVDTLFTSILVYLLEWSPIWLS